MGMAKYHKNNWNVYLIEYEVVASYSLLAENHAKDIESSEISFTFFIKFEYTLAFAKFSPLSQSQQMLSQELATLRIEVKLTNQISVPWILSALQPIQPTVREKRSDKTIPHSDWTILEDETKSVYARFTIDSEK
jgi:hypothetical protein